MEFAKVKEIYFSPTGSTKAVTKLIGDIWKMETEQIDISNYNAEYSKYHFSKNDLCFFGVPSFGGRVPQPAVERISQMKGENTRAILIVTYGNRAYDDTFLELKQVLEKNGFICSAAIASVTEHSIMHNFAAGRPDLRDKIELKEYAGKIKEELEHYIEGSSVEVPGKFPYKDYNGVPMKPKAGRTCSSCGTCAVECPVGAIPKETPKITDKEKCISCMRCVAHCPKKARKCSPMLLFTGSHKMKKACAGRKHNELFLRRR